MNTMLKDFGLIWRHAVMPRLARTVVWSVCAFFLVGAGLFVYLSDGIVVLRGTLLLVLPWFFLGVLYWFDLVSGVVKQVTPANARLVPRLRLRAMQLVAAFWVVLTVSVTLILGGAFGNHALWAAAAAAWLAGIAMINLGLQLGALFVILPSLFLLLPQSAMLAVQAFFATAAGVLVSALCILLAAWVGKRAVFPEGDRHFDQRAAVDKGVRRAQGTGSRSSLYTSVLGRVERRRTAAAELVLHALGPGAHWSVSANMLALLAAVLLAGRLLIELTSANTQMLVPLAGGFVIFPLLLSFAASAQRIVNRATATPGEQALLRLAPVMAHTGQYNRHLATALLRRALIEWALVTVALVAVTVAINAHWQISLLQFAVCCLAMPLSTVVVRDYARKPALRNSYIYLAAIYLVLAGGLAYYAMLRTSAVPVAIACIALGIGATAWLAQQRYRTMVGAPVAFPAGRMAA